MYTMAHFFLNPGPTPKRVSPSFLISSLGLALKCTLAQKKNLKYQMRIPPPGLFNTQTLLLTYLTNSTFSLQKKENYKNKCTRADEEYTQGRETSIIKLKGGFVTFIKNFKYLGGYISYYLQYDYEIDARLAAGNASMGALTKLWTDASVDFVVILSPI